MPSKVRCVWIVCVHNSEEKAGETGECLFDGIITLTTPDEEQLERIEASENCEVEADEILMCDQLIWR